jgi:hypothetical protein
MAQLVNLARYMEEVFPRAVPDDLVSSTASPRMGPTMCLSMCLEVCVCLGTASLVY